MISLTRFTRPFMVFCDGRVIASTDTADEAHLYRLLAAPRVGEVWHVVNRADWLSKVQA